MRAAAQPSVAARARRRTAAASGGPVAAAVAARRRSPSLLLSLRRPAILAQAAATSAAAASPAPPETTDHLNNLQLLPNIPPPAPNPRPPRAASAAAYSSLALAHALSAALLAALSLLQAPGGAGGAPLTACLALGPASSVLAPALGACLAAASARAAGLCLFVRGAALAAEGRSEEAARRRLRPRKQQDSSSTGEKADNPTPTDDNDVSALRPLPTELRTWRYQRPNAALLASGALSALAHAFGLVATASSSSSSPLALLLPLAGLILSIATTFVAANSLRWAVNEAERQAGGVAASGAVAGVAFACEPLAEALGGGEDVREDRELAEAAAAAAAEAAASSSQVLVAGGVAVAEQWQRQQEEWAAAAAAARSSSSTTSTTINADAAVRATLAHLARDATTLQGLALTACWTTCLGALGVALFCCLGAPLSGGLPAAAAAASATSSSSDPALTYLLFASGVAALPALAGAAHALCEQAAYTRRLDVPATLRASLLAKLGRVSRARRVARGRARLAEAGGLLLEAPPADAGAGAEVVDVGIGGGVATAAADAQAAPSPTTPNARPLFPPPPHNAPPSRFAALRTSFACAAALQLMGIVAIGASSPVSTAPHTLSDPRFVAAQAAAQAALGAADPAVAALHWTALLGGVWLAGQLVGLDFLRLRQAVTEGIELVSRVIDLIVRGLYWDAYWILQDRVAH